MAFKIETDPKQLADNMEFLYTNVGEYGSGVTDALAHIGQIISGDMTPDTVQDVQDELMEADPDGEYTNGYTRTWNKVDRIIAEAVYRVDTDR